MSENRPVVNPYTIPDVVIAMDSKMLRKRDTPKLLAKVIRILFLGLEIWTPRWVTGFCFLKRVATELDARRIFAPTRCDLKQISTLLSGDSISGSYPPIALKRSALINIADSGTTDTSLGRSCCP